MCGIVGIVSRNGKPVENGVSRAHNMINLLKHRGPDAAGIWKSSDGCAVIGNTRLSIVGVVDNINAIAGTKFFGRARSVAYTYALGLIRRDVNQMYDESDRILANYKEQLETLLGDLRAIAPQKTAYEVVTRNVPAEDDYFAERHTV